MKVKIAWKQCAPNCITHIEHSTPAAADPCTMVRNLDTREAVRECTTDRHTTTHRTAAHTTHTAAMPTFH